MPLRRRSAGAVIAVIGALGVSASAYLPWHLGDVPQTTPISRLFDADVTGAATSYWTSVAAPLAIVGALGVLGGLFRSRIVLGVAWAVGALAALLWLVMLIIDSSEGDAQLGLDTFQRGAWLCLAGLTVLAIGIVVMDGPTDEVEVPLSVFDGDPR